MSATGRQPAVRVLARELNDIGEIVTDGDGDMAPKFAPLPTHGRANRVFVVGTCTEIEAVGDAGDVWRGRVVDPTGTAFVYAGQYLPVAARTLRECDPPAFVAVVGKPRTFETDEGDVLVSIRPEHVTIVERATRDRWLLDAASATLDRLEATDDGAAYREAAIAALEACDGAGADGGGA